MMWNRLKQNPNKKVKTFMGITPTQKEKGNGHASKKLPSKGLSREIANIIPQEAKNVKK
jgi:hypothetical protein